MKAATKIKKIKAPTKHPEIKLSRLVHTTHLCATELGARCVRVSMSGVQCGFRFDASKQQGVTIYSPLREYVVVIASRAKDE